MCSQYVIGSQVAEELPWFLFVEDPMAEYMNDMETIGHAYSLALPLLQNCFAFKDELDFVYDMQLKDFKDSNHKLDDGVSYEALQIIEKQHGKIFEECKKWQIWQRKMVTLSNMRSHTNASKKSS